MQVGNVYSPGTGKSLKENVMALELLNLDERTRQLMLEELEYDIGHNQLHISPVLSGQGQRDYPNLLRDAIREGNEETLASELRGRRRLSRALPRRRPQGGYLIASTPSTAADTLAEGEFNRYYIRAVCRRALEDKLPFVIVYRAKPVRNPRPESVELVENTLEPAALLEDLRAHPGESTELNVPAGPNSGISVRLP
jgi:hypothetical protein